MTGNRFIILTLFILTFSSCCHTSDSRVPTGYPFNDHSQELNFTSFKAPPLIGNNPYFLNLIKDSSEWNKILSNVDPNYPSSYDFDNYNIAWLTGYVELVHEVKFQKRVLIDHMAKTYTIELRAYAKTCSGMNSNYHNYYTHAFLLVPKVPEGYFFQILRFDPVK